MFSRTHPGARVALVHDYLTEMGGAERVVESLLEGFPDAPLYTSVFDSRACNGPFATRDIRTSFMQRLTRRKPLTKALFPLFPRAFRSLDLRGYDVVLSSASGFAHHVRPSKDALHICYCHNTPRFLWQQNDYFRHNKPLKWLAAPALARLRRLDVAAAGRVDAYVANSAVVAERIATIYGRHAHVIHPPVPTSLYSPSRERSGRFLVVSRLVGYKRVDLVVEAASRLGLPLDVIGDGPDRRRLESIAGPSVRFLGRQPDAVVRRAMATAVALVMPGHEDFGLTAVESQASGRPPIAFAAGGALETVEDGETGFLFPEHHWESVAEAMERAQDTELAPDRLRAAAERFDVPVFLRRLSQFIEQQIERKRVRARVAEPASAPGAAPSLA